MPKFMKDFLTNRLGLGLVVFNLVLIALNRAAITDALGLYELSVWSFLINLPAHIVSYYFERISLVAYGGNLVYEQYSFITIVLVVLQWLSIGWLATVLARLIRRFKRS